MHNQYSLSETAKKLGVTSAWINRLQRETAIGGKIGKKGHKVIFSAEMVEVLRGAKVLRLIGFSFNEIKDIYDTEEEILKSIKNIEREYEITTISHDKIQLVLHTEQVPVIGGNSEYTDEVHKLLSEDKNIERYIYCMNKVEAVAKEVLTRQQDIIRNLNDVTDMSNRLKGKYTDISE